MNFNVQQIIYFCLINYVSTFPIFDELWETNQLEPQANNNPIESQPKIKVEPHEEQFDGRWQDESALKRIVKVEYEPHYGAVKVEGADKIKHEFEWWAEESDEFKEQLEDHVKEEVQDGQAPNTSDQKNIGDNSKKELSDQNNSTDQDESVDGQQNESNECENIDSNQQKREIIEKFREIKDNYRWKNKHAHSTNEWNQIERNISNDLGVGRSTIYKWIKELGLCREKFSDLEKRQILKQFDEIKSKCKKAKLKSGSINELDKKIAKKLGVSAKTIYNWKRKFGLSVINKKFSDETKIEILKKYAKLKRKNPKMRDLDIADLLKISTSSLIKWKAQFREEIKHF